MKCMFWAIVLAGFSCFCLKLITYVIPESLCVLLSFILFVALVMLLIVSLIFGFTRWRKSSRFWLAPALVCTAFVLSCFYLPSPIGRHISDWRFGKHVTEYSRVVDGFRSGAISCRTPCEGRSDVIEATDRPAHIRDIWGVRCDDGGLLVLFRVNTDVPFLHEGYLFKGYGEKSDCNTGSEKPEKRFYLRLITGRWYSFSDQPGF